LWSLEKNPEDRSHPVSRGGYAADSPAVTTAAGLIRQSQQIVASNAAASSKAAEKGKAAKAAAGPTT